MWGCKRGYRSGFWGIFGACTPIPPVTGLLSSPHHQGCTPMLTEAECRNATCPPYKKLARFYDGGGMYMQVSPRPSICPRQTLIGWPFSCMTFNVAHDGRYERLHVAKRRHVSITAGKTEHISQHWLEPLRSWSTSPGTIPRRLGYRPAGKARAQLLFFEVNDLHFGLLPRVSWQESMKALFRA